MGYERTLIEINADNAYMGCMIANVGITFGTSFSYNADNADETDNDEIIFNCSKEQLLAIAREMPDFTTISVRDEESLVKYLEENAKDF